ncbi:MAG: peptide chain release factor N(5)-glutamine methyltransferase [Xanthomonadaceae bacterium]|jgi:release factor glutamine methyltransferase|nr:peptide chain release factor N(5)-glutamine methyltransferase [Xanthomonadaceae bacterium]
MNRITEMLRQAAMHLPGNGHHEAEQLLMHVLRRDRAWLFAHGDERLTVESARRFMELVVRRIAGEPVAYLTGIRGFWTLDLEVTPATLIPRPETELLVELTLAKLPDMRRPWRVADLGTGSGAIALSVAIERPRADVVATDISAQALMLAQQNAERHAVDNVEFRCGDWFAPLVGEHFDLIVSNPPYIAQNDPHLRQGDLRFEPLPALISGADGLDAIRAIAADAAAYLCPDGWLLLEHGWEQGPAVRKLLHAAGLVDVTSVRDLEARERVSLGRCKSRR